CPDTPSDQLARLPIGQRDSRLLRLRELTFGPRLNGVAQCPRCFAQLELAFDAAEAGGALAIQHPGPQPQTFTPPIHSAEVGFRLPNRLDVAAIAFERNVSRARRLLLERCVIAITHSGSTSSIDAATPQLLDATVQRMAEVDPQGDVQVMFACPSCGNQR